MAAPSHRPLLMTCLLLACLWLHPLAAAAGDVRPPVVAGRFYPASAEGLRAAVVQLMDRAPEIQPAGEPLAAMAPHAGYVYSGAVAAIVYKSLSAVPFDTLVIIGHDSYLSAVAFTCPVSFFQTPLGKVPVDLDMISKLHAFNPGIKPHPALHRREHTIEVQLPFLQAAGRSCKIVPLLFGFPSEENCRILSEALLAASGEKRVFLLASTDLSHYPPYDWARKVDLSTLEALGPLDAGAFFRHAARQEGKGSVPNLKTTMCAKGGVGTALRYARKLGANHFQLLQYANSGDVPNGDRRGVVGYAAALMVKRTRPASK